MSIYDRDYSQAGYRPPRQGQQMHFQLPQVTPIVRKLLIINVGVFLACIIIKPVGEFIYEWFRVDARTPGRMIQLWRLIGYQFLHDPRSVMHIVFNMIGLYFLGPTLERHWGSGRFLKFYLLCGTAGGIFYMALVSIGALQAGVLIGASGAILGMLAACAILFPQFVVFFLFFPVPIRIAAMILTFMYVVSIFTGAGNAGGDAAHLAGMAAGAFYVYLWPRFRAGRVIAHQNAYADSLKKKMRASAELQRQVDEILEKVNASGINSLTKREKKVLADATKLQQQRNQV